MTELVAAFTTPLAYSSIAFLLSLIVIRFTRISLRNFLAVYLLLGAMHLTAQYVTLGVSQMLWGVAAIVTGLIATLLAVGFIGKTRSSANYQTLMVAIGFFPWWLGWTGVIIYLVGILLFGSITFVGQLWASSRRYLQQPLSVLRRDPSIPEQVLEDIWSRVRQVMFATPVFCAGVSAILYTVLI